MPSLASTSTQVPMEPAASPKAPRLPSLPIEARGHQADLEAQVHPGVVNREASAQPAVTRRRGRAAFNAIAPGLRRVLADSARAWALAAGAPTDLVN